MKKGRSILLFICALSLCFVLGIFVGRNSGENYVALPQGSTAEEAAVPEQTRDYRMDINSASKAQLMELPGIGEKIAQRIIDYRTENGLFSTTDELLNVDGIGEKTLQQIENKIKVGG